jgi:hypothetical protein
MSAGSGASFGFKAIPVGLYCYLQPDINNPRLANRLLPLAKFSVAPTSRHFLHSGVTVEHFRDLGLVGGLGSPITFTYKMSTGYP